MANEVRTYYVTIGSLYNGTQLCTDPDIQIGGAQDVAINCIDPTCGLYKVQVGPGQTDPCITFVVKCEDCGPCKTETITKCFCDTIDDCGDCETCNLTTGFCDKLCPVEDCVNDTCVECTTETEATDCQCNQVCQNGGCGCPAGTTLNLSTGCCDQCATSNDCDDCDICQMIGGVRTCVPKQCTTGVIHATTCLCVECNNTSDCGPGECCTPDNECECCPGFKRINGVCTYVPCSFDSQCDICEYCDPAVGCVPKDCSPGVCNPATGNCEEPCDGDCPPGYGCLDGFCVPCDTLSCSGVISQCSQAQGCGCNGDQCEYVNCKTSSCVDWVVVPPVVVPGTPTGSGTPAPAFTVVFTQLSVIPMSGGSGDFLDYSITITETGGNSGSWTVEGTPLGSGSSVTFELSDPTNVQWNNVGFEVNFVGTAGQTGSIVIWNTNWTNPANGYVGDLFITPANWAYDVQGTSVAPTSNGGSFTPGSIKLCPCGEDSSIIGYNWVTTEGNLTLTFTPLPDGCVRAIPQGCGLGEGTVTIDCAGIQTVLPIPPLPYDFSGANCCNPLTDPNCNSTPGDGFGCTSLSVLQGELVLSNTNYITGDGFGLFRGVFQPDSIGYTVPQWIRVARSVCWSVTGTVREATSFIPPTLAHLFHDVEYRDGSGCLRLGYTCDIKVANCKKVQAEYCFVGCSAFDVSISGESPTFSADVSLGNNVQVSYAWSTNTGLTGTAPTFTIPTPNSTITQISVVVTLSVNGVICTASDAIVITLDAIEGCTNPNACNYNEDATVDDGSCIIITRPVYDCALGFVPGVQSAFAGEGSAPVITYRIGGTLISTYQAINPGTYDLDVYFNGILKCTIEDYVVPQCYKCSSEICVPSPSGENKGPYTTIDCGGACSCDIEIVVTPFCNNNQTYFVITATGDTGQYSATVTRVAGAQLMGPTNFTSSTSATTPLMCNGVYNVVVTGENCSQSVDFTANCFTCAGSLLDVTSLNYNVSTNVMTFTIVGDPCSSAYNVSIEKDGVPISGLTASYGTPGVKSLPFGFYRGDGVYTVRLIDNNGCVRTAAIILNENGTLSECPITVCSLNPVAAGSNVNFSASFTLDASGGLYTITLYNTTGGSPVTCSGASLGTVIATITNQPGVLGVNNVNFTGIAAPAVQTCYGVKIEKQGVPSCTCTAFESFNPGGASQPCSGEITSVSYNEATGEVIASWAFVNTSNDLTITVNAYPGAVCGVGTPVTVTTTGNGAGGSMVAIAEIPQLQGQDQCLEVIIYDTNDPTCTDTFESEIPGCTCSIEITDEAPVVDIDNNTITFEITTTCTSGDINVVLTGDAAETTAVLGSTTGVPEVQDVVVTVDPFPSTGGTYDIEVSDDADAGCTDTRLNNVLPENCESCFQVVTLYNSASVVTEVRDEASTLLASGTYDISVVAEEAALEAAIESGLISEGANICSSESTPVDVVLPREAGIIAKQDSSDFVVIDHALITNADWVGTRKSYFGDCGCETGRTCDYTTALPIAAADDTIIFFYGGNNGSLGYTGSITWTGMTQTPSAGFLTGIQNDILTALTTLSGCAFTVASVSVTYDEGTDILTVTINDTNAAIGIIQAVNTGVGITTTNEFTQSGCA